MENFKILSVKDGELEQCALTIRMAFAKSANDFGFTKENYPSSGTFITAKDLKKAKDTGIHMYAAWVGDTVAGFVQLAKKENDVYSFQKFSVLPSYQQLGLGKVLINFCKNKAKVYGGKKISLIMVDKNTALKEFYTANGFKIIGHKEDADHPFLQCLMEFEL